MASLEQISQVIEDLDLTRIEGIQKRLTDTKANLQVSKTVVENAIIAHNNEQKATQLLLQVVAAPRYYQAQDPAVMLAGSALKATRKPLPDLLPVALTNLDLAALQITDSFPHFAATSFKEAATSEQNSLPWNPLFMNWEVELEASWPETSASSIAQKRYKEQFIQDYYQLEKNKVDLSVKTNRLQKAVTYKGHTFLADHTQRILQQKIEAYLSVYFEAFPSMFPYTLKSLINSNPYFIRDVPGKQPATFKAAIDKFGGDAALFKSRVASINNRIRSILSKPWEFWNLPQLPGLESDRDRFNDFFGQANRLRDSEIKSFNQWKNTYANPVNIIKAFEEFSSLTGLFVIWWDKTQDPDLIDEGIRTGALPPGKETFVRLTNIIATNPKWQKKYPLLEDIADGSFKWKDDPENGWAGDFATLLYLTRYVILPEIKEQLGGSFDAIQNDKEVWSFLHKLVQKKGSRTVDPSASELRKRFKELTDKLIPDPPPVLVGGSRAKIGRQNKTGFEWARRTLQYHKGGTLIPAIIATFLGKHAAGFNQAVFKKGYATQSAVYYLLAGMYDYAQSAPKTKKSTTFRTFELTSAYISMLRTPMQGHALEGLNEALMGFKASPHLDIKDLSGSNIDLSKKIATAIGNETPAVFPQPENVFHPIREGALSVKRLEIIDSFGKTSNQTVTEQTLATDAQRGAGKLNFFPRIVPPARLNFRWLSARGSQEEMNSHPATTPVCGWLLPNNLDSSLEIYNADGKALGIIRQDGQWGAVPGALVPSTPDDIVNPHLNKLVQYVLAQGKAFIQNLMTTIDNALINIEPESYAQHTDLSLLVGRPLAVVRSTLNLELKGGFATEAKWTEFTEKRHISYEVKKVKFPIRLGEYRQLNDGLVGYLIEENGKYKDNTFYAPQADNVAHAKINTHEGEPCQVFQSIKDDKAVFTMLLDVRGSVHATSGILPTKAIHLPPDQYKDALQNIEVTFRSMPVITPDSNVALDVPAEAGYQWQWLEKTGDEWNTTPLDQHIAQQALTHAFGADVGVRVWNDLVAKGWIQLQGTAKNKALIVPPEQRQTAVLDVAYQHLTGEIDNLLEYVRNTRLSASFDEKQVIREGWLRLKKKV